MPHKQPKDTMVTVRLAKWEREQLQAAAASYKMSLNAYCRYRLGLKANKNSAHRGNPRWKKGWTPHPSEYTKLRVGQRIEIGDLFQQFEGGPWVPVKEQSKYRGLKVVGTMWHPKMSPFYRRKW